MKEHNIKTSIVLYLVLAFVLPLICLLLNQNLSIFQTGLQSFILFGIQAATPTISAFLTIAILDGGNECRHFIKRCYFDNIKIKYIILAAVLPIVVLTLTKLTSYKFIQDASQITGIGTKKLIIIVWALIAEEVGWRGFLQARLNKFFGHYITPLLIGVIWALWHYHLFLLGTTSAPLLLFVLGCIADSYGYYWVTYKSDGNVIPASIWHFTGNLFFNLYLINPEYNHGSCIPYLLYVGYTIIMAVGISVWGVRAAPKYV